MTTKKKRKSLVGWTLKKPILIGGRGWSYFDDGKNLIAICTHDKFEKGIDKKMFKKVRITVEEL